MTNDETPSPADRLCEFLRLVWMDNTPDEARAQWATRVEQFPDLAQDSLEALDSVIADPPENLVELMQECGWISLYEETYDTVTPLGKDAYVDWLRSVRDDFGALFEERAAGS